MTNLPPKGGSIVFELDPQPAANLSFKVVDKVNGKTQLYFLHFRRPLIKKVNASDPFAFKYHHAHFTGSTRLDRSHELTNCFLYEENITVNDPSREI
jgi:hypothetical protein